MKEHTQEKAKDAVKGVGKAIANVGVVAGLPPVSTDPEDRHDSGPDETRPSHDGGHPVRKRQSDLGTG